MVHKICFPGLAYQALFVLLSAFIILAVPNLASGAEVERSHFAESVLVKNTPMELVGTGLLRYWGLKAYRGALYLAQGASPDEVFLDRAKRIELEYLRPFKAGDFGHATDKMLAENVDHETLRKLRPRIDYHNALYEDVKVGDRYSLTYIPGRGTELALNGEFKGLIQGADFADAIFSIWLGPNPISEPFKRQILGL